MSVNRRDFLKIATGVGLGGLVVAAHNAPEASAEFSPEDSAKHPAMLYDTTLCIGCRACQTGCRNWNETSAEWDDDKLYDTPTDLSGDTWTLIQIYQDGEPEADRSNWSFIKRNCMHCLDPACVSACTVGALQKSAEGPVVYDLDRCFGCRYCMVACPYHIPRYQWESTVPLVQKCTFCSGYVQRGDTPDPKNRLVQGLAPACVEACPAGALVWGTRDEILAEAHARIESSPGKYHEDRVYGEFEAGGTLQLVLSHVPFEALGLPTLDPQPLPDLTDSVNLSVPGIVIGVGGLMTAIYSVKTRAEKNSQNQKGG